MFDHSIHRTVWIMSDRAPSSRKRKVARKTVAAEAEKASRRKQLPRMTASKNWNVNLPREVTQSKERKVTKDPTEEELRIIQDNDCKSSGNECNPSQEPDGKLAETNGTTSAQPLRPAKEDSDCEIEENSDCEIEENSRPTNASSDDKSN